MNEPSVVMPLTWPLSFTRLNAPTRFPARSYLYTESSWRSAT